MPRSNKKKKLIHHPVIPIGDEAVTQLLGTEITSMISKAIVCILLLYMLSWILFLQESARKHGINLKHGTPNPGTGDTVAREIIADLYI